MENNIENESLNKKINNLRSLDHLESYSMIKFIKNIFSSYEGTKVLKQKIFESKLLSIGLNFIEDHPNLKTRITSIDSKIDENLLGDLLDKKILYSVKNITNLLMELELLYQPIFFKSESLKSKLKRNYLNFFK